MENKMADSSTLLSKTTISPEVLVSIAKLATLGVEGVARLAPRPGSINRFIKTQNTDGVKIVVEDGRVYIDIYAIICRDQNVREVSHTIQTRVARSIFEIVGMEVGRVNIHVEDIDYFIPVNK